MPEESAAGIGAPGGVGDKIAAKEKARTRGGEEDKRGRRRGQKEAEREGNGT